MDHQGTPAHLALAPRYNDWAFDLHLSLRTGTVQLDDQYLRLLVNTGIHQQPVTGVVHEFEVMYTGEDGRIEALTLAVRAESKAVVPTDVE